MMGKIEPSGKILPGFSSHYNKGLGVERLDFPVTQKLSSGNNQLEAISNLCQFGVNGMNLDAFGQLFGNPAVLRGTLTDGTNNSSTVSLTINLP